MTRTASTGMRGGRSGPHRARFWIVFLAAILAILVGLDFAARAVAESVLANKIQQQGLQHRPDVTIEGFPFLTQLASRNFQQVNINASNQVEGSVTITKINGTARNIHVNSFAFSSGTIGKVSGSALISFGSLANTLVHQVGPLGSLLGGAGLKLEPAGPTKVRARLNLLVTSGSATWSVTQLSGNRLRVQLVSSNGLPTSLLGSIQNIVLQIPKLPLGLTITSVRVTPAGVVGKVSSRNVPFGS